MTAYATTTVPVEKSQGEIRGLLAKHKAQRFAFGEESGDDGRQWAAVTFSHGGFTVRMRVPHKALDRRKVIDKANPMTGRSHHHERQGIDRPASRHYDPGHGPARSTRRGMYDARTL